MTRRVIRLEHLYIDRREMDGCSSIIPCYYTTNLYNENLKVEGPVYFKVKLGLFVSFDELYVLDTLLPPLGDQASQKSAPTPTQAKKPESCMP